MAIVVMLTCLLPESDVTLANVDILLPPLLMLIAVDIPTSYLLRQSINLYRES